MVLSFLLYISTWKNPDAPSSIDQTITMNCDQNRLPAKPVLKGTKKNVLKTFRSTSNDAILLQFTNDQCDSNQYCSLLWRLINIPRYSIENDNRECSKIILTIYSVVNVIQFNNFFLIRLQLN